MQGTRFDYGRSITSDFGIASKREWLVTNGVGGFASGTIAGLNTRRYHGLLVAALAPPLGRTLLVPALQETATSEGERYPLHVARWRGGVCDATALRFLERFRLDGTTPVWSFALGGALLEKRVWMERGHNATIVTYRLIRGTAPVDLAITALVNARDYHGETFANGGLHFALEPIEDGIAVTPAGGSAFRIEAPNASMQPVGEWYYGFELLEEKERGFHGVEDHFAAARIETRLGVGEELAILLSASPGDLDVETSRAAIRLHEETLLERSGLESKPEWIQRLVLAADQFLVGRRSAEPAGTTILAGYPWFTDWGRDTMIALPGLTLATRRYDLARSILRTYAAYVSQGMIPNRFPDRGETPEYNTMDATLWMFEAIRQYVEATVDVDFVREIFPTLRSIVESHLLGTRFNIAVDPRDGLLRGGEPGLQITWMDAKIGDWVVTPRIGKPVEINALWHQALRTTAKLAHAIGVDGSAYEREAQRVAASFARFWNPETAGLFDVLDGPNGDDRAVRPNQIFAVSLPDTPLSLEQCRSVVDLCTRKLLTSHGLRSLCPDDPDYCPTYSGDFHARDAAYHRGTVWGWLLGPFAIAHQRAFGDAEIARSFLEPMQHQLDGYAIGTLGEIFDAEPPHAPRGCFAQAWTVAEVLRAWLALSDE
ncbi:MAG TPA: amylo-alpha-1,6-glucosidase [Thermoanaerobaculia bacterium]